MVVNVQISWKSKIAMEFLTVRLFKVYLQHLIYIYIKVYGLWLIVTVKSLKRYVADSAIGSYFFSLVSIKNLINLKSKLKKKILLFVLYCLWPSVI